jgi:hypothetical protein
MDQGQRKLSQHQEERRILSFFFLFVFQDVIVAGGMESLSNSPFYLNRGQTPYGQAPML